MKLTEYQGEDAIALLGDIIEPLAVIFADNALVAIAKKGRPIDGIKYALKKHSREVLEILAAMEGVPVDKFRCNILTLPEKILEIVNDKEIKDFFISQLQSIGEEPFGAATETIPATDAE